MPSGASTGSHEAVELRDGGDLWNGSGVEKAVKNVNTVLREILVGSDVSDQEAIDELLIEADGSENKSIMGANAILGCSMAAFRASSLDCSKGIGNFGPPCPSLFSK